MAYSSLLGQPGKSCDNFISQQRERVSQGSSHIPYWVGTADAVQPIKGVEGERDRQNNEKQNKRVAYGVVRIGYLHWMAVFNPLPILASNNSPISTSLTLSISFNNLCFLTCSLKSKLCLS